MESSSKEFLDNSKDNHHGHSVIDPYRVSRSEEQEKDTRGDHR